ncbi:MAG: SusC/RagA family TonB-linked outer membrane protein, partial [Flavobacteriales bacterium]|nr:SusC/RagA family TonB-linked outer membrane protein [Flavobacteriales bacterium]
AYKEIFNQLKYNPFDVDNDMILGSDGKINPSANVIFPDLNWYDPLEQTGYRQNYNLSASGGGEKHTYFFSLGYLDETGYMTNSDYNRINARINLNMTPKKWLKIGTNFSGSLVNQGLASTSTTDTGYSNPFYFARSIGPIYPVYVVDPNTGKYINDASGNKIYDLGEGYQEYGINSRPSGAFNGRHIVAELDYNDNYTKVNNLSNRTFFQFNIIENLKLTVNASIDINNYKQSEYENDIVGDGAPNGRYSETRYSRTVLNFNQLLNYSFTLGEDHNFDVLLGHENFSRNYTDMYGMKSQQVIEGIYEFDNFVTPTSLTGATTDKRNEGYFSRLNYDYMNRYYLSASYRYDGSSVFHEDNRWGGFYSVGLSWRITEENFMQDITWLDNLKLRGSYGEVGNDNLAGDYYAFRALYSTRPNGLQPGLYPSTLGNDDLTWESNKSFDIALDFGFFNNRLKGSVEFYKKISEDLLYNLPIAPSIGLDTQPRNVATIYNQGFEFGLGIVAIQTDDFRWNIDMQASTIKNEITDIPAPFINGSKRWHIGHSIYDYFLYDYYGVDSKTGAAQYHVWEEDANGETHRKYDADGNPVLTENYADANKGYTGSSSIPDLFGSITNSFSYRGFTLDILFTYSIGGETLDYSYASLMQEGDFGSSLHVDQLNGWRQDGDNVNIPRLENGNVNIAPSSSDRWLTDASYLSLRNINFSYMFDQKALDKIKLGSLRLFVTGENLFVSTGRKGMNPQQSFAGTTSNVYLPSRVFSFGVDVGF